MAFHVFLDNRSDMNKSKRKARSGKELQRRKATRSVPDRVLIVTEGSKTEPTYFRKLIQELGLTTARVQIVGDGGSAPKSVVEEAEKRLNHDADFEQIYCIFDRDRHTSYDIALQAVRTLAESRNFKTKTVCAITSVPCFELWYLLHVSESRKPYESASTGGSPAQSLISDLKKNAPFNNYEKKDCEEFYKIISEHRENAIARAENFLLEATRTGDQEFHENPSTRVHIVVKALMKISEKQKNEKNKI